MSWTHPLEWSSAEIQHWMIRENVWIPALAELHAKQLWYLSEDDLKSMLSEQHDAAWTALKRLRQRTEEETLLSALIKARKLTLLSWRF